MATRSKGNSVGKKAALCLAVIFALAALVTSITALVLGANKSGWFEKEAEIEEPVGDNGGMIATPNSTKRMALSALAMSAGDEGLAPTAESGYTVSATVYDENGDVWEDMQYVEFSMAWATTNAAAVTDYVTMTVDGTTATFSCLKAFPTQIIVTCQSTLVSTVTATTTLDYRKRVDSVTLDWKGTEYTIKDGNVMDVDFYTSWATTADAFVATSLTGKSVNFGTGSVSDSVSMVNVTIESNTALDNQISNLVSNVWITDKSSFKKERITNITSLSVSEYDILSEIYGTDKIYPNAGVRSNVLRAISNSENQFAMKVVIVTTSGQSKTFNVTLNVAVESTIASSITLQGGGYIF